MGRQAAGMDTEACAHGGMYSVDYKQVRLDFSSSVNPLGPPAGALREITKQVCVLSSRYPDPECTELREGLAAYLSTDPERIIVGNGAVEIIYWFAQSFARKRVVIPAPTFCEYELASGKAGAAITLVRTDNFRLDSDPIIKAARGADAIYLCNPNNPTGLLDTSEIERILQNISKKTMVLLDECFIELVTPSGQSFVSRSVEFENLVILRSMTKSFALAGLRVGYSVCSPAAAARLKKFRTPWNVNGLAQAAGVAALSDRRYLHRARKMVAREKEFLFWRLGRMKSLVPHYSDANYFMVNLPQKDSRRLRDALLERKGILVRDCSTFSGMDRHHIRIAVKSHKENLELVKAVEEFDDG